MQTKTLPLILALTVGLGAQSAPENHQAAPESHPAAPENYTFRAVDGAQSASLQWMDGVSALADLRGKPVLIEFWGRR